MSLTSSRRLGPLLAASSARLGFVLSLALLALVASWLASAAGHPPPHGSCRGLALVTVVLGLALLLRSAIRLLRGRTFPEPAAGPVLLAALGVALAASFWGLGHEIGGLYFADEGIFLAQAQRINAGQLLRGWFVYPHLLFYLDAFALWLAALFQHSVDVLAAALYGLAPGQPTAALVTRGVTATLGAATVVPAFALARRLGGFGAGALAAALMAGSPLWREVSQLNLADVAGGFLAALSLLAASNLLDIERPRDYALAGLAAGLAASAKYPAGVVVVAAAALWLSWRLRQRRARAARWWSPQGLLILAATSIVGFLLATPSLLAFPGAATSGGADVLFGVRLYARHGWPGVVRGSNLGFYLGELRYAFGAGALLLGFAGLLLLRGEAARRVLRMLPFPILHFLLLLSMKIAVRRNLMALHAIFAVLLAVGLATLASRLAWWVATWWHLSTHQARRVALVALSFAALAAPAQATWRQLYAAASPSTREEALRWIRQHVPPGATFVQEAYTPELAPPPRYFSRRPRLAIRVPRAELAAPPYDYLLLASEAYDRFLRPEHQSDPALAAAAARYRELFAHFQLVASWQPSARHRGPEIRLYRLPAAQPRPLSALGCTAPDCWLSDDGMRQASGEVAFTAAGQWALLKGRLGAGTYLARVAGSGAGEVSVRDAGNHEVSRVPLRDGTAALALAVEDQYFVYAELGPGGTLTSFTLTESGATSDSPGP